MLTHALITAARNEAARLGVLASTVVGQAARPQAWVIVDDGSSDDTVPIAEELAAEHEWISVIRARRDDGELREGRREGRDLLCLQEGICTLETPVELVTKLDADVTLPPDYFERIVAAFASNLRLGLASGTRCELDGGVWKERFVTGSAVQAQCRTYRWSCWEDVQPLDPHLGWDGVDEARAVLAGWETHIVPGLRYRHHRPMGDRDGSRFRGHAAEGIAAHYMGYRPSYLVLRALWHARREPAALGMVWGWASAVATRGRRCDDAAVRGYVRRQQSLRHLTRRLSEVRGDNE